MNSLAQFSLFPQIMAFASLAFCLISLVTTLNVYWRSHKMLRTFAIYCIISVGIFSVRKLIGTVGLNTGPSWTTIGPFFDLSQSFFFMLAAIEFYKIIRRLDGEVPPRKK